MLSKRSFLLQNWLIEFTSWISHWNHLKFFKAFLWTETDNWIIKIRTHTEARPKQQNKTKKKITKLNNSQMRCHFHLVRWVDRADVRVENGRRKCDLENRLYKYPMSLQMARYVIYHRRPYRLDKLNLALYLCVNEKIREIVIRCLFL